MNGVIIDNDAEKVRKCCNKQKKFYVVYDGGIGGDFVILVCEDHWNNDLDFRKFVKRKEEL